MDDAAPEHEPLSDYVPTKTVTIVAEENLTGLLMVNKYTYHVSILLMAVLDALAEYEQVTSFHVYSLAPFPQKDLALLADVAKSLSEYRKIEDAAKTLDTYGVIANPQARKKERKGPPPVPVSSAPPAVKKEPPSTMPKPSQADKVKQETKETPSVDSTPSSSAGKKPPATLKRGASGGIMQSFAKAAAKPPKPKPEPKPKEEDTSMALSDDGEADDADLPAGKAIDLEALKRTRKEREEQLMRMMEDPEDEVKEEAKKEDEQSDEEMEEASEPEPEPEPEQEPEPEPKEEEKEPAEVISNSSNGRRRGKRRVMKKKRILDDQGYMGKVACLCLHQNLANSMRSYYSGGCMGVVLRRRGSCSSPSSHEGDAYINARFFIYAKVKEGCRHGQERKPRQHHVILRQKVTLASFLDEQAQEASHYKIYRYIITFILRI